MKNKTIAFIGAGNMASSLIGGLVAKGWQADHLFVSDPVQEQCQRLAAAYGVQACRDNNAAVAQADVLILAIKPQVMRDVLLGIQDAVNQKHPLVISIAAGIPLSAITDILGSDLAVIRCMPNTPAMVGMGATGLIANSQTSVDEKNLAQNILAAVGIALWLENENQIDAVTALSGSGPAYYFLVMEAMIAAGISLGLDAQTARTLTLQTALGAATMAQQSNVAPAELRRRVTSPGGTTEQALRCFEEGNLVPLFATAMAAAEKRSKELAINAANP